jgi:hypothetical protein
MSSVVGQSPGGKNVSTEAEDILEIRYRETAREDIENWEDLMCVVVNSDLWWE